VRFGIFYGVCSVVMVVAASTDGGVVEDAVAPFLALVWLAALVHSLVIQLRQPHRALPPPRVAWTPPRWAPQGWAWTPSRPGWARRSPPPVAPPSLAANGATVLIPPAAHLVNADIPTWAAPTAAVDEPWAGFVRSAERARERFHGCARQVHPGDLRTTFEQLAGRIDTSVAECRRIAAGGRVLAGARAAIDTAALDAALLDASARRAAEPGDALAASTVAALESQRATAARMDEVIDDTIGQLRLLDARLGEAVARMLELTAQAEAVVSTPDLSNDVDGLLADLEALRLAVEETHAVDVLGATALPQPGPKPGPPEPAAGAWDQPG
jgi:hypothetical protein